MEENIKSVLLKNVERVKFALEENNMQVFTAGKRDEVPAIVESLLTDGETISVGGSVTLAECGVLDLLKCGKYKFLDRETNAFADTFLCSSNAVTENGELYNVDGSGSRVSSIAYGPKSVIIVAGMNKLVPTLDDAIIRVKKIAAPANATRLNCITYCAENGECMGLAQDKKMATGCNSDMRICCSYLVSAHQRVKNRIKVILVGETLGY